MADSDLSTKEKMTSDKELLKTDNKLPYLISIGLFLFLFVCFVYGALFIALLGLADWIIHSKNLEFFVVRGAGGVVLFVLGIILLWFLCAYLVSLIFYAIFSFIGGRRLARQASLVVFFAFFHIFTIPWILWPSFRNNVPCLKAKYRAKLKKRAQKFRRNKK